MGRKKEKYILENVLITDFAAEGNSIAKQDDKVIFVPYTVPGDVADIEVYKQKKSYCFARLKELKQPSNKRIEPKCRHFTCCGGCSWQNLDYSWQLKYKQQQVIDNLTRIGKCDCKNISPIIGSDNIFYYRNKLEFTFSNKGWVKDFNKEDSPAPALGFHISGLFDKVLPLNECFLQKAPSNDIRNFIKDFTVKNNIPYYNIRSHEGMMRTLVIRTSVRNDVMVIVVFAKNEPDTINTGLSAVKNQFPQITSLQYCINDKMNDSLADREFIVFYGKDHIDEYMPYYKGGETDLLKFKIRPKTFCQVNVPQAIKLYTKVADFAEIEKNDVVYDLYTGTGTIANFIAQNAKKVIGIEYVEDAIEDAKINSKENNIENTLFFAGDMAKVLTDDFIEENSKPDIIITDPPRNGMAESVVRQILNTTPKRIVYVSCNPATQARDLLILQEKYKVTAIQPVDMFPHTHHIENIVRLDLVK